MTKIWDVIDNDSLDAVVTDRAVTFLRTFIPSGVDQIWSVDYFHWKLGESNPAGTGFMTVAESGSSVVGVTSITKKRMWDGYSELLTAEIGDTFTHPDFRREGQASVSYGQPNSDLYLNRSVFGRLVTETVQRAETGGIRLIYGTPNSDAMPGYVNRLGFQNHKSHYNHNFVRPTSRLLSTYPIRPITNVLGNIDVKYSEFLRSLISWRTRLRVEDISDSLGMIDALWYQLRDRNGFGLLRDSKYFAHRFTQNPLADYKIWGVYQGIRLCGVFVTRIATKVAGRRVCYLADWLLDMRVDGIFKFVLASMIAENIKRDISAFNFWAEKKWAERQRLRTFGFIGRGRVPIIFRHPGLADRLDHRPTSLEFTMAISDNV